MQLTHPLVSLVFFHPIDVELHGRDESRYLLGGISWSEEDLRFFVGVSTALLLLVGLPVHDVLDLVEEKSVFILNLGVTLILLPLDRALLHMENMLPLFAQVDLRVDASDIFTVHLVAVIVLDGVNQLAWSLHFDVGNFTGFHFMAS